MKKKLYHKETNERKICAFDCTLKIEKCFTGLHPLEKKINLKKNLRNT